MSVSCRLVTAGYSYLNTASSSSIVHFGDASGPTEQSNRVIAVQRAVADYVRDETRFSSYSLFYKPLLNPEGEPPVQFNASSCGAAIRIGSVYTMGLSASSILRYGCAGPVTGESRILNIRHFNNRDKR